MASVDPSAPQPPAQIHRFRIGANVLLQILLLVLLVGMANYVGIHRFRRWDFSKNQKYALSPVTKQLLRGLKKPVKAVVFFNAGAPVASDVGQLLREFEFASKKKFEVETVDPYNNVLRAKELAALYKFGSSDNIVILDYGGRSKFVPAQAMAEFEQGDTVAMMSGQPPRMRSFKGEQAITSALLELVEEKQNKVYLVGGHGEPAFDGDALQLFKTNCKRQNILLAPLNLNEVDAIPEDATSLLLIGARADISERENRIISEYWSKNGRLFVLLDPEGRTPRLDTFLLENCVAPTHDRILRTGMGVARDANQQLSLQAVVYPYTTGVYTERGREISKDLVGIDAQLPGPTQSLELDLKRAQTKNLRLVSLMESSKEFWGETEFIGSQETPFFDPNRDHRGPLVIASAVERGAVADRRVKVDTSRMIVAGNAAWVTDEGLRESAIGIDFAMNGLNWLLNREQLIGIAPKEKKPARLDLNERQLQQIALAVLIGIPGVVALAGFGAWIARRS
jgi:hypothetical protein